MSMREREKKKKMEGRGGYSVNPYSNVKTAEAGLTIQAQANVPSSPRALLQSA